jgi:hypothetical protein
MARRLFLAVSILAVAFFATPSTERVGALGDDPHPLYEVTVTNLLRRQVLTPTVAAVHNADFRPLFEEGHSIENPSDPATRPEVRPLVEEADAGPLFDALSNDPAVRQVKIIQGAQLSGGIIPIYPEGRNKVILPGKSASITIEAGARERLLSLIGMLGQTNDSFYALRSIPLPNDNEPDTYYAAAYDAGTEVNNELCAFVPGAPCGSFGARALDGEGFVRISEGIHGVGSLPANLWDWRNPVAKISIRRL